MTEALMQGLIQGGVASFCMACFTYYLMPRIDKLSEKIDKVSEQVAKCHSDRRRVF